ncbi:hypothetical protein TNCV_2479601 [Trichonephila clavipes]|nr:hypothetical protein TNCV_2479601 [Trichonephila clavipes]
MASTFTRSDAMRFLSEEVSYIYYLRLKELRHRIEATVARITSDILNNVWDELAYRLDVLRVRNGVHIEHLMFVLNCLNDSMSAVNWPGSDFRNSQSKRQTGKPRQSSGLHFKLGGKKNEQNRKPALLDSFSLGLKVTGSI